MLSFHPKPFMVLHCLLFSFLNFFPAATAYSLSHRKCSKFEAIVFDSYGTLIDVDSIVATVARLISSKDAANFVNLWRSKQLHYTWLRSLMISPTTDSYKSFWEVTRDALKYSLEKMEVSLGQSEQAALMNGFLELSVFPEVKEVLRKLKKKYKIAVLSNGTPEMLRSVFEHNELGEFINPANEISVDEVKVFKPNPVVYALAESKLRIAKSKILFVSGNYWDVVGAKSYGLQSVWINRKNDVKDNLGFSPDLEFTNLNQLSEHLSKN